LKDTPTCTDYIFIVFQLNIGNSWSGQDIIGLLAKCGITETNFFNILSNFIQWLSEGEENKEELIDPSSAIVIESMFDDYYFEINKH
jgi:hypothetical protein